MKFEKQALAVKIDPTYKRGKTLACEGYVAVGTGLGYFIDPKPEKSEPFCFVNGQPVYEEEDETRFSPMHVQSGMSFSFWFYDEQHVRAFIEEIAVLLDWTQPVDVLVDFPAWPSIPQKALEIARRVTGFPDGQVLI